MKLKLKKNYHHKSPIFLELLRNIRIYYLLEILEIIENYVDIEKVLVSNRFLLVK